MLGQVVFHLLAAAGAHRAPWPVVVLVSCMPVVTLGFGAALTHLLRVAQDAVAVGYSPENARTRPGRTRRTRAVPERVRAAARRGRAVRRRAGARRGPRPSAVSALDSTAASRRPRRYRPGCPHSPVPRKRRAGVCFPTAPRPGSPITRQEITIMSTDQHTDQPGAEVVPLRAAEVPTEVQLDEDRTQRPSYVDLSRGEAHRRPIIPEHWRSLENAKRHVAAGRRAARAPGRVSRGTVTRRTSPRRPGSPCGASSSPSGGWSPGGTSRARPGWNGRPPRTGCSTITCGCTGRAGRPARPAARSSR